MAHCSNPNAGVISPITDNIISDLVSFLDGIDLDQVNSFDYYAGKQAIQDCIRERSGPRRSNQCCFEGVWWTTLLTHKMLCKFAYDLESKSLSWLNACDMAMVLLKDAENKLDNAHIRHLIKDFSTLMRTRLFKHRNFNSNSRACPVFYWKKDVMRNARKGLPLQFGLPQAYLNQAEMYKEQTRIVPPLARKISDHGGYRAHPVTVWPGVSPSPEPWVKGKMRLTRRRRQV